MDSLLHLLDTEGWKQEKEGILIPALEAEGKGGVSKGHHSPADGQLAVHTDQEMGRGSDEEREGFKGF